MSDERPEPADWAAVLVYVGILVVITVATAFAAGGAAAGRLLTQNGLAVGAILLLLAGPLAVALLATRFRGWPWAGLGLAVLAGDWAAQNAPFFGPLTGLRWNWHGKLLATAAVLAFARASKSITLHELGVTSGLRPGWWKPLAIYAATAAAVWALAFGAQKPTWKVETFCFQATMPGLSEELAVRGLLLALLARAFGRGRGGASGWAVALTCWYFAVAHMVSVSPELEVTYKASMWPTGFWGLLYWWVRERTGSIWPAVLVHNLSNLQLLATYGPWAA